MIADVLALARACSMARFIAIDALLSAIASIEQGAAVLLFCWTG